MQLSQLFARRCRSEAGCGSALPQSRSAQVRQQHLVNLEALAREQLLRHDWGALPATLAALLSAQVHCSGARLHSRLVMHRALRRRVSICMKPDRACREPVP